MMMKDEREAEHGKDVSKFLIVKNGIKSYELSVQVKLEILIEGWSVEDGKQNEKE